MAILKLEVPFAELRGTLTRGGVISRKKMFRDENGRVIFEGQQEAYAVRHPRNFKRNPPKGAELAHHNRWREACKRAHAEINDPNRREYWQKRFYAQIPGGRGTKADPQAPIDRTTQAYKRYGRFDAFVRAMIYLDLKQSEQYEQNEQNDTQNTQN